MPALGMHLGFGAIAALYGVASVATCGELQPIRRWGWRAPLVAVLAVAVACGLAYRLNRLPQINEKAAGEVRVLITSRRSATTRRDAAWASS